MRKFLAILAPLMLCMLLCASCAFLTGESGTRSAPPKMAPAVPVPGYPGYRTSEQANQSVNTTMAHAIISIVAATNIIYDVEVADTPDARNLGLMRRDHLDENAGMLFVFDTEAPRYFWMKSTLIPLDILFIGADKAIVDIQTMTPCANDPCPLYASKAPAKYALEINSGEASRKGMKEGQTVLLP
jgi:uncharacterized membrane protein (UPF0127 family)